ncbi:14811_t:CDS:1 [Cetraspora pellucida]|uniref:14811_t:CDS:1 n=1 Tax=Cetraspora pellucida TaxID=1433469 RepID=A0A9N9GYM7_9GLOM|nr:14811_t:CDS:1 [Cetraspora pellucida]
MTGWKLSFERLSKYKYVAYIIYSKKIVCICDKKIKLYKKWKKNYLNHYVQFFGYKANEGQKTIYNWFQLVLQKEYFKEEYVEEEYAKKDEYDSDIYDNMEDNDLIQVAEIKKDSNQEFQAISIKERLDHIKDTKK